MSAALKTPRGDRALVGIYIGDTGVIGVELAAMAGFDYIRIDNEHTLLTPGEIREMIRIAERHDVPVLIRTPSLHDVTRMLDFGATGILLPNVQSAEEAARAVSFCKYAPIGSRGVCRIARCTHYALVDGQEYVRYAQENVCLAVQIESEQGMLNLDEILAVPGVDMVTVGPEDLAQSLGFMGQTQHQAILDAQLRVLELGHKYGKTVMLSAGSAARFAYLESLKADLLTIAFDTDIMIKALKKRIIEFIPSRFQQDKKCKC